MPQDESRRDSENQELPLKNTSENEESPDDYPIPETKRFVFRPRRINSRERLVSLRQKMHELDTEIGIHPESRPKGPRPFPGIGGPGRPSRTEASPPDEAEILIEPVREFKTRTMDRRHEFIQIVATQRLQVIEEMKHKQFFLDEFKKNQWDANPMLDRQRIAYSSQIDALKRELRSLDIKLLEGLRALDRDIMEADRELIPFELF